MTRAHRRAQAYTGASKNWKRRHLFLWSYAALLRDDTQPGNIAPTADDVSALRRIAKDARKPIVERVHAQLICGDALWHRGAHDDIAKAANRALELAARATQAHRAERMMVLHGEGHRFDTAGELIDVDVERCKKILAWLSAGDITLYDDSHASPPAEIARYHPRRVTWPIVWHTDADRAAHQVAMRNAFKDRSAACSHCGAGGSKLQRCAKCRLAYYCSPACQRAGWAAHRPHCRTPGEHRAGDIVRLQAVEDRPTLNGQLFCVLRQDLNKAGCWLLQHQGHEGLEAVSVHEHSMRHVLTH